MAERARARQVLSGSAGLVVLTLACSAAGQRAWRTPGQEEAASGRELAAAGRCAEAVDYFDRAIVLRRGDARLRLDRGRCHERLGNTRPAIEDFRAFLSAEPNAPEAEVVREHLRALQEQAAKDEPAPPPDPAPPSETAPKTPPAEGEPPRDEPRSGLPQQGGLLGLHLGYRDWNSALAGQTLAIGIEGGWTYRPGSELTLRLTRLDTNELDTDGYGISAAHGWSFALGDRLAVVAAIGGGFETQRNEFRVRRNYYFGRATPSLRFALMDAVVLQGGLELGVGSMPTVTDVATNTPDTEDTHFGLYWGGRVELLWVLGG